MCDERRSANPRDIGPEFVAHPRPDMVTVDVEGDAIVYDEQNEVAHLLSPTGAIVWRLLDGRTRLDELASELAEAFGVDTEQVLEDVVGLAQELGRRGLLESVSAENTRGRPA